MRIGISFQAKDDSLSGVEYYALTMIQALVRHAPHNQYVVYTNRPEIAKAYVGPNDRTVTRRAGYTNIRLCRVMWEHLRLPRLAEREKLDVMHYPCYICPVIPCEVPSVVTVHDTIALDRPEWCTRLNAAYYGLFMRPALRRAAKIVAVSRQVAADLGRNLGTTGEQVRMIYPGLDPIFSQRKSQASCLEIRKRYRLPERYILHVGNLEPKKNLDVLLEAFTLLEAHGLPQRLVLVGGRQWKARGFLRRGSAAIRAGRIIPTGYVSRRDLPGVYQMADLYVCPSLHEGFGFPPLEAMASGVPVVSSGRGALKETLAAAAYAIDPKDPGQIADAMAKMLLDRTLREEYIERGQARSKLFDWCTAVNELQALYAEVAG